MLQTLELLASDSSHLPLLTVFKESRVMEKYGFELELAGEIDFVSGLHHETYRERARGEKRLVYLAQAQNNWDDRLMAGSKINKVEDLKGRKIICHTKAPCVAGNLGAVLETCGLKPDEIQIEASEVPS